MPPPASAGSIESAINRVRSDATTPMTRTRSPLRNGDRLRVIGVVSPERTRLIAESIEPAEVGGGVWTFFPQAS